MNAERIEAREALIQLYDFYGTLLTERQNLCFVMHYIEDLSLAEIGGELSITPQAVADQIKRTSAILRRYEEKLALAANWKAQQAQIGEIRKALSDGISMEEIHLMLDNL